MIGIFFEYNRQIIQLPVNPEEIEVPSKVKNESSSILTLGEIAIAGLERLKEIKISSFLPSSNKYPFILTKGDFREPQFYIDFFNKVIADKKPMKIVITDTNINMNVLISSFNYSYVAQDDDLAFDLTLSEYKPYSVKTYALEQTVVQPTATETVREASEPCVGSKVVVNGQLFADSYGGGPGKILSNYNGIVSIIKKGRAKPYHIINSSGGWMGWVAESSIKDSGEISNVKMNASTSSSSSSSSATKSGADAYGNNKKVELKVGDKITLPNGTQATISGIGTNQQIKAKDSTIYGNGKKTDIPKNDINMSAGGRM